MLFNRDRLRGFVELVYTSNHLYHVVRRQLYGAFVEAIDDAGDIQLPIPVVIQVRLYLMARSEMIDDIRRYAFENAVASISALL